MPITFDRSICCDLNETITREWLITNGRGGYAAGTIAGALTRMEHGLLVAALDGEDIPQLLLAKIDEEVHFDQRTYYLGTNEYRDGTLNPAGFVHLESFSLEDGLPVFTYHLGGPAGMVLEKRIWMPRHQNTTCIQYRVLRTTQAHLSDEGAWRHPDRAPYTLHRFQSDEEYQGELTLTLLPFTAHRPYNRPQFGNNDWHFQVQGLQSMHQDKIMAPIDGFTLPRGSTGCTIRAWNGAHPYSIFVVGHPESQAQFIPTGVWYWHFLRRNNREAGEEGIDDLYLPGVIRAKLWPGEEATLTIIATAEELSMLPLNQRQLQQSRQRAVEDQYRFYQPRGYFGEGGQTVQTLPILPLTTSSLHVVAEEEFLQLLFQASDRFLMQRVQPHQEHFTGASSFFSGDSERVLAVLSGYFSLGQRTRETLISLPGLLLATRRFSEAARILRTLARYFRYGLLPDRLPTTLHPLEDADYSSIDTTLWYFYALDHYINAARDYELLDELYPRLVESLSRYISGTTRPGIQIDSSDGLLNGWQEGQAFTWMNAVVNGAPVTPRGGKPVEVNALWYYALCLMDEWSNMLYRQGRINHTITQYCEQAERCRKSFNERFWYAEGGYLYDVIDGPDGNDHSLRPNQILALSLRHAVLRKERYSAVLEAVNKVLVTPYGLRTLAPGDPAYRGHMSMHGEERQRTLHQGSAWPWLIGPFIEATLRAGNVTLAPTEPPAEHGHEGNLYQEYIWRKGLQILEPFRQHLSLQLLGMISEVYSGDAPHASGQQVGSATGIGEILRAYQLLTEVGVRHTDHVLSA